MSTLSQEPESGDRAAEIRMRAERRLGELIKVQKVPVGPGKVRRLSRDYRGCYHDLCPMGVR